jgi:polysaccharide deacetylase family protein (PEP-CTERM system associated)
VPEPAAVLNAMTVDVEDYFQVSAFEPVVPRTEWVSMESRVVRNTERILDLLAEADARGTFFVLGWVAERFPRLVSQIVARGHEIASHSHWHQLVYAQTPGEFRADLRRAKQALEDAAGVSVTGYRAPSYSITKRSLWALDVLIEEGFRYDASIFPIHHDRYGIPGSPRHPYRVVRPAGEIVEVPGATVRLGPVNLPVGGGGYFRMLPYAWTRWGFTRINADERRGAVFYLHPWEVDPDQPRIAAGRLSRFRHYRNLSQTEARMVRLLADFRFTTLGEVLSQCPTLPSHTLSDGSDAGPAVS